MTELKDDIIDVSAVVELLHPFRLLLTHYKLVAAYLLLGLGLTVLLKFILPQVYHANFILKSNERKDKFFANALYDLEQLSKNKDFEAIATELKLNPEEVKRIHKLESKPFSHATPNDTSEAVFVEVYINKGGDFLKIQNSIISYLENNTYYQQLRKKRLASVDSMRIRMGKESRAMDSVKKLVVNAIKPPTVTGGGLVYNVPVDPYKAFEISLWHFHQKLELLKQVEKTKSFELIKPCVVSKKPIAPRYKSIALYVFPVCFLFALVHVLILDRKKENNN
jgi:hypothetical protein